MDGLVIVSSGCSRKASRADWSPESWQSWLPGIATTSTGMALPTLLEMLLQIADTKVCRRLELPYLTCLR